MKIPSFVRRSRLSFFLAAAVALHFGVVRAPSAAAGSLDAAGAADASRVTNVFTEVPAPWVSALGQFVPSAASGLTPVVMILQSKGYSIGADPASGRPVLKKDSKVISPADATKDVQRAKIDSYQLVSRVAGELAGRSADGRTQAQLLDDSAKLHLLGAAGLSQYLKADELTSVEQAYERSYARLSEKNRTLIAARMRQIATSLGRAAELDGMEEPGAVPGGEKVHAAQLERSEGRKESAARAEIPMASQDMAPVSRWAELRERFGGAPAVSQTETSAKPRKSPKALDPVWVSYDASYRSETTKHMNEDAEHYRAAYREGDASMRFLAKAGAKFGKKIEVPGIAKIFAFYRAEQEKRIAAGTLKPDEMIEPVRLFRDRNGKIKGLPFGSPIPSGYRVERQSILSGEEFLKLIADGKFPVGEPTTSANVGLEHSMTDHDLSHLAAFWRDLDYAIALRRAVKSMPHPEDLDGARGERVGVITEFLNGLPAENAGKFAALLPPDVRKTVADANVAQVQAELMKRSGKSLDALRKKLYASYPKLIHAYGGSSNDLAIRVGAHKQTAAYHEYDSLLLYPLREQMLEASSGGTAGQKKLLAESLARFIVGSYQSSQLSLDDLISESFKEKVSPDSKLHKFLCDYGVWGKTGEVYRYYCE